MEEAGAALLCSPLLSSGVLAAELLRAVGDEAAKSRLLPGIAAGTTIATVALTGDRGTWTPDGVAVAARKSGQGWSLDGTASYVIHGQNADVLLVVANAEDGMAVFEVDAKAAGVTIAALPTFDHTLRLARITFAGVAARRLAATPAGLGRRAAGAGPGAGRAGRRAGRRRPAVPGVHGRLRQDPHPVRPAHRQLPGDQAHGRRPAAGVGVGHLGRPQRRRTRWRRAPRTRTPRSAWPPSPAPTPSSPSPRPRSRCTAASPSPGPTRPTSICAARAPTRSCSARRPSTASAICSSWEPDHEPRPSPRPTTPCATKSAPGSPPTGDLPKARPKAAPRGLDRRARAEGLADQGRRRALGRAALAGRMVSAAACPTPRPGSSSASSPPSARRARARTAPTSGPTPRSPTRRRRSRPRSCRRC